MNIKIFVSHHKEWYIYTDENFHPIHVWKEKSDKKLWISGDDTGDNISKKNETYAELTLQYRVWKNYDLSNIDYIGFCHYRRYFSLKFNILNFLLNNRNLLKPLSFFNLNTFYSKYSKKILQKNNKSFISYLQKTNFDICLPKPMVFVKWNVKESYEKCHIKITRDIMKNTLISLYPEYKKDINEIEKSKKAYICNMFIMKKKYFIEYNERLFPLLWKLENEFKKKWLIFSWYQSRVYWYLWERLLNIRLSHKTKKQKIKIIESNILFLK